MKKLHIYLLAAIAAFVLSFDAVNAQTLFLPAGQATGSGGIGVGANPAFAPLDVVGNNILLRPSNSFNPNGKFIGIGESGGTTGQINGCDLYGFRAQATSRAFINVGLQRYPSGVPQPVLNDVPTISWGSDQTAFGSTFSRTLEFRYDNTSTSCGGLVARMSRAGTYQFTVFGSALASGGSWVNSDARFKQNIKAIDEPLDLINRLEGTTYTMDRDNFPDRNFNEGTQYGFIAQDLQKVMPTLVKADDEGFFGVNYDAVVPLLVEGIKSQQGQIEAQEIALEEARQTNVALQEQMEQQEMAIRELQQLVSAVYNEANKTAPYQSMDASDDEETSQLFQNRPNPVTDQTEIPYFLPTTVGQASLVVYNLDGREMLRFNSLASGSGRVILQSEDLPAGNYVYRLIADDQVVGSKKITVAK